MSGRRRDSRPKGPCSRIRFSGFQSTDVPSSAIKEWPPSSKLFSTWKEEGRLRIWVRQAEIKILSLTVGRFSSLCTGVQFTSKSRFLFSMCRSVRAEDFSQLLSSQLFWFLEPLQTFSLSWKIRFDDGRGTWFSSSSASVASPPFVDSIF